MKSTPLFQRILSWASTIGLLLFFPIYDSVTTTAFKWIVSMGAILLIVALPVFSFTQVKKKLIDWNQFVSSGFGIFSLGIYFLRIYLEEFSLQKGGTAPTWVSSLNEFLLVILVLAVLTNLFLVLLKEWERESLGAQSSLNARKQSLIRDFLLGTGVLLLIIILANYISSIRNYNFDLSAKGQFSFSLEAKKILKEIPADSEIEVVAFFPRPLENAPSSDKTNALALRRIRPDLEIFLGQLSAIHPGFKVKFVNADVEFDELAPFGQVSNGTVLVRYKKKDFKATDSLPEQKVSVKDKSEFEDFERKFVQAVVNVSTGEKKVYFTQSNGERFSPVFQNLPNEKISRFTAGLGFLNFKTSGIGFKEGWPSKIPEDADLVAIVGPTIAFSPDARKAILEYLTKRNGKLLVTIEPKGSENFDWLLKTIGYSFEKTNFSQIPSQPGIIVTKSFLKHPIEESMSKKEMGVVFAHTGYFQSQPPEPGKKELEATVLLESGGEAYLDPNQNGKLDAGESKKNLPIGLVLQTVSQGSQLPDFSKLPEGVPPIPGVTSKEAESSETAKLSGRAVIFSGTSWITDQYIPFAANFELATGASTWMQQSVSLPAIPPKKEEIQTVSLTDGQKRAVWILGMFIFPGIIVGLSSIYVVRRRNSGRSNEK
ncbi:hypothetical protein CH373_01505 [Leptospira perolatii]|uniref:Uncharacterized protein n=1 Tax=Leptospira perolatii TaxID=2023191 RepID=A0A2M9ZRP6_9LEPT|nr:Gldg family protein [Leptospira perolatii]PJZ71217.1 hypothetical protein CH360_01505 [Leptospira perolatii]PJZ74750.1 hypothetical protein CH373_01505 [Leptospira perolatii]